MTCIRKRKGKKISFKEKDTSVDEHAVSFGFSFSFSWFYFSLSLLWTREIKRCPLGDPVDKEKNLKLVLEELLEVS